ncbi:alpha/beta hydrolase [Nonomuraea sp. NPDC050310]|uniref:alpha/beta hydrolase n=1 Tax=Nonomuraea sp. NPDC050310 TaxID=3154935 RepID=UPI0033F7D43E
MRPQPTYVFVHGTNANAHHWTWIMQELALRGHRTLAVDLPGHGRDAFIPDSYQRQDAAGLLTEPSPTAKLTVDDYVGHVEDVVRRAHRNGPVILVGHSQGGVSLSLTANRVPNMIQHLVYISAFCCVDLPTPTDYVIQPELQSPELVEFFMAGHGGDPNELGVNRVNWRSSDPAALEAFRALVAHTYSAEEARTLFQMLQPDEPGNLPDSDARGHRDTWGRIPRTYVRLTLDRLLPPAMQDRWIEEADRLTPDNRFKVHSLESPHFLPRDLALVDILDDLA